MRSHVKMETDRPFGSPDKFSVHTTAKLTNVLSMYLYCCFTFEPSPLKIQLSVGLTSYELLIRLAASGMYNAVSGIQTRVILLATTPVSSLM